MEIRRSYGIHFPSWLPRWHSMKRPSLGPRSLSKIPTSRRFSSGLGANRAGHAGRLHFLRSKEF